MQIGTSCRDFPDSTGKRSSQIHKMDRIGMILFSGTIKETIDNNRGMTFVCYFLFGADDLRLLAYTLSYNEKIKIVGFMHNSNVAFHKEIAIFLSLFQASILQFNAIYAHTQDVWIRLDLFV